MKMYLTCFIAASVLGFVRAVVLNRSKCQVCIDFGSSGAKVGRCEEGEQFDKCEPKFMKGAGAFERVANNYEDQLEDMVLEFNALLTCNNEEGNPVFDGCETYTMKKCAATAGNRFDRLRGDKDAKVAFNGGDWTGFNTVLAQITQLKYENTCEVIPGTEEARLEWSVFDTDEMYIGIGGASMQIAMKLSADSDKCSSLDTFFPPAGAGARRLEHFCKFHDNIHHFSFLSDFTKHATLDNYWAGGQDESQKRFFMALVDFKAAGTDTKLYTNFFKEKWTEAQGQLLYLDTNGYEQNSLDMAKLFMKDLKILYKRTLGEDKLWNAFIQLVHQDGVFQLPSAIGFLSNAGRPTGVGKGQFNMALHITQELDTLAAKWKTDQAADKSRSFIIIARMAFRYLDYCRNQPDIKQIECFDKNTRVTSQIKRKNPLGCLGFEDLDYTSTGFGCGARVYGILWILSLSGAFQEGADIVKVLDNVFHLAFDSHYFDGDWMTGYTKLVNQGGFGNAIGGAA